MKKQSINLLRNIITRWGGGVLCLTLPLATLAQNISERENKKNSIASRAEALHVGAEKQLFIDHRFIASSHDVQLVVNRPRITKERLLVADKPWESDWIGGYSTVIQEEGMIKMWYEAAHREKAHYVVNLAYAYSTDGGATWVKPNLGIIEFNGSKENNLVTHDTPGIHVFRNRPDAPAAEKYCLYDDKNKAYVSPDGLHWTRYLDGPLFDKSINEYLTLDSQNVIFWDPRIRKYVAYPRINFRHPNLKKGEDTSRALAGTVNRIFGYGTSDTLEGFKKFKHVFARDEQDSPDMDWYTTAAIYYPYAADTYVMFPAAYHHYPEPPVGKYRNDGPLDIQFASSRDGVQWNRDDRRPLIRLGVKGSWDSGAMYAGYGLSRQGDELSLYYTVHDITHGAYVATGVLGGIVTRAQYRLDGFVSADAAYNGGEFTTPAVVFDGTRLELNLDGSAGGWAKVEILDEQGQAIPGYSIHEADKIAGNSVAETVTWSGKGDVAKLKGRPIKLRFVMRDAKLYAFQFVP